MDWKEILTGLGEFIGGILVVLIPVLINYWKKNIPDPAFIKKNMGFYSQISNRLVTIRAKLNYDRVAIFEFSNGEKTITGFPFLYSTMTYERTEDSIQSIKNQFNRTPSSWFASINKHLISTEVKYGIFHDDGTGILDGRQIVVPDIISILKAYNFKSYAVFKLDSEISNGLLVITDHTKKIEFSKDDMNQLFGDCFYINNIFNSRPKHK